MASPGEIGRERARYDLALAALMTEATRDALWDSVDDVLRHGPLGEATDQATGLVLGYVQSGKTTNIIGLAAAAADAGYRVVIAFLGSTHLLVDQNGARIREALIDGRPSRPDLGSRRSHRMPPWLEPWSRIMRSDGLPGCCGLVARVPMINATTAAAATRPATTPYRRRRSTPYRSMLIESRTACSSALASGESGERFWVTNTWRWPSTSRM